MIVDYLKPKILNRRQCKNGLIFVCLLLLAIFYNIPTTLSANTKESSAAQWRHSTELNLQNDLARAEQNKVPDDLLIASALVNLANFYKNIGNWGKAQFNYDKALKLRISALGTDNLLVASTLVDLGELQYLQGKYDKAEPIFLQAIAIEDKPGINTNAALADALEKYAKLLYKLNRASEANKIYTHISKLRATTNSKPINSPINITSSFQKAVQEYNKKDFKLALDLFLQAHNEKTKDPNILFYLGNCYFNLNQMIPGLQTYWTLISNFPETPKAKQARAYIQKVAPDFLQKQQQQIAIKGTTLKSSESDGQHPIKSNNNYTAEDIIVILKGTGDRQDCSPQLVSTLKDTFNRFPKGVRCLLGSNGSKIYITPSTIEKDPRLQNTRPHGYEDGTSWKNCPGYTYGKEVVICTSVMAHDESGWVGADDPISTLRHEIGHEIDYLLGEISDNEEYKHNFLLDIGGMDDYTKQTLAYYTQKADAGPHESFAEITCSLLGGGSTKWRIDIQKLVMQNFPRSTKYVSQLIQNPNLGK